jgi:hypothetical protein
MFSVLSDEAMGGRGHRYRVLREGEPAQYLDVLDLWHTSDRFRSFFIEILSESPFTAYRWETPPATRLTGNRPFEFVLVDSPQLAHRVDSAVFAEHFSSDGQGIVTFENLGGDALLVVPSPRGPETAYGHLAAFTREAPSAQVHALWELVGELVRTRIGDRPIWLSTAGGGVAWLHVRLDSRPKYYAYTQYKDVV